MTDTDLLTGLKTYQALQRLVSEHKDERAHVVLLDVRHLMRLNDEHGARDVDEMLAMLGRAISGITDAQNDAFRLGGDLFMVMTNDPNSNDLRARVEEAASTVRDPAGQQLHCTTVEVQGLLSLELLHAAHQALYAAKASSY